MGRVPIHLLFPVGLNIKEVAHDYQPTIRKYLEEGSEVPKLI